MSRKGLLIAVLLGVAAVDPMLGDAAKAPKRTRTDTEQLGGAERYLTHLSTDKPLYRQAEPVHIRGVMLQAQSHKPFAGGASVSLEIHGPKGDVLTTQSVGVQDSTLAFTWTVPKGAPGGEYTVKAKPSDGNPPAERKFEVRAFRAPRLSSDIVFLRDGYGPGDAVEAKLHVERAEGGVPKGAKVTAIARVDGAQVHQSSTTLDAKGDCSVSFALPKAIERGDGTLAMVIEDGGVVETATKTIPILINSVDVTLFPEGGELIAGLPNRVYLEARTPAKKPADIEGAVLDGAGHEVAAVKTEHEGRGRFTFTPKRGESYSLRIDKPAGIKKTLALSKVQSKGALLSTVDDVVAAKRPVRLQVGAHGVGSVTVTVSQREVELAAKTVQPSRGHLAEVVLPVGKEVSGVLIATVWDANGKPLAERLLLRLPDHEVRVEVQAKKKSYTPGEQVELVVSTTDEHGKPEGAVVGLTVSDASVYEMVEKREQPPQLPVMVFLEDDVKELADAQVYLDKDNPKAPLAVDLLLGTQGWRRFALANWNDFLAKHGDAARRALAHRLPPPPPPMMKRARVPMEAEIPMAPQRAMIPRSAPGRAARPEPVPAPPPRMAKREQAPARPQGGMAVAPGLMGRADRVLPHPNVGAVALPNVWVREYAHQGSPNKNRDERNDFTDTVYWNAGLRTDPKTGKATVQFALSDAVTSFRVAADAFDGDGDLGSSTSSITSVEPFYAELKLPLEVTSGDNIALPVTVVNSTASFLNDGRIKVHVPQGLSVRGSSSAVRFDKDSRTRTLVELSPKDYIGEAEIKVEATAGNYKDSVTRRLKVVPHGFPIEVAQGGVLEGKGRAEVDVDIPQTVVAGSTSAEITVYPAPLANLTQALERLVREPHGCFEQTSSTNYPLVMAQQYFQSHGGIDSGLIKRSREILQQGYDRLRSFECKTKGYEWFGQDPGHEALSAYGLLEFTDMAKVMRVDQQMLHRTRSWILAQRNGNGGFTHNRRALHTWLTDEDLHNGFITWALLEAGEQQIASEAKSFKKAALASDNSYVIALGANVALKTGDTQIANTLMKKLVSRQNPEGWVDGSTTSVVGSQGLALQLETTSLAVLAWLNDPQYSGAVERAMRFVFESCKGGRFGSTQSTVLALRAVLAYDRVTAKKRKDGAVQLVVDGKPVGSKVRIASDAQEAIKLVDITSKLGVGHHRIALQLEGGNRLPFGVAVRYHAATPESSQKTAVAVQTRLAHAEIAEGASTEIEVTMRNLTDKAVPMPIAIIGVPGGLEVRHEQLKELKKAGRIAFYEVLGRDVVLYWRELAAKQTVSLPISLVAAVPGTYTAPASRAYLYYGDEDKRWVPGERVTITAK